MEGPLDLVVDVCGLTFSYPFYCVDADVPSILGYDLMSHAHLVLDVPRQIVYSRHPNACLHRHYISPTVPLTETDQTLLNLNTRMVTSSHAGSAPDVTPDIFPDSASDTVPKVRLSGQDPAPLASGEPCLLYTSPSPRD